MGDNNGERQDQDEFERRLYQALALIERAGEQQRTAAATLERLSGLEQRVNEVILSAGAEAAGRIAREARTALDGAITASAESMRQAARSAVAAAENLRLPWWLNLVVILLAGLCGGSFAFLGHPSRRSRLLPAGPAQPAVNPGRADARTHMAKANSGPTQETRTARWRAVICSMFIAANSKPVLRARRSTGARCLESSSHQENLDDSAGRRTRICCNIACNIRCSHGCELFWIRM